MKYTCSITDCQIVANYKNQNGQCFCRKHANHEDPNIVHVDWRECPNCHQLKRLYKGKCMTCGKTREEIRFLTPPSTPTSHTTTAIEELPIPIQDVPQTFTEDVPQTFTEDVPQTFTEERQSTRRKIVSKTPTATPKTPMPTSTIKTITEIGALNKEDTDKQMIKMLKVLSRTRPIEVTVYKFTIFPNCQSELE